MIKLGITGGIGSGKSIVSHFLSILGVPIYSADDSAKRITASSPEVRGQLITLFGSELYHDGELNKSYFASIIFNDKKALSAANSIIHPAVAKDFASWAHRQQSTIVGLEAAILIESGFQQHIDYTMLVTAPIPLRIQRVMLRDGLNEEEIRSRIVNQLPDEEKIKKASFVIVNDDKQAVIPQVLNVWKGLLKDCY